MNHRGAPGERVLAWAVRLLPAGRREWGRAMQAELAGIQMPGERRRFAWGCLGAAMRRPRVAAVLLCDTLMAATAVGALVFAAGAAYRPLRVGAMVIVAIAVVSSLLTGRVADGWPSRLLRLSGYGLITSEGLLLLRSFAAADPSGLAARTGDGLPPLGVALTLYIVAIAALTAHRARISRHVLVTAGVSAAVVGLLFATPMLFGPPLIDPGWALLAAITAGSAALLIAAVRADDVREGLIAGLSAFTLVSLLFAAAAEGVLQFLPSTWVPDTSPPDVPAADRLANNSAGAADPYRILLGLGALAALALVAVIVAARWHLLAENSPETDPAPAGQL